MIFFVKDDTNVATHVHLASERLNSTACIQQQIAIIDLNMVLMSTVKPVLNGPFLKGILP
jgi:hypothetical protein